MPLGDFIAPEYFWRCSFLFQTQNLGELIFDFSRHAHELGAKRVGLLGGDRLDFQPAFFGLSEELLVFESFGESGF